CAILIISCLIISNRKHYWNDELFSFYFVSDSSFFNMLRAFHDKINNSPILYFLFGWIWDKIFGSTEVSLRLFSSLAICMALVLVWVTLRRIYGFWATSIGTLAVFCTSPIILIQNSEARMYALYLAFCALGFFFYDYFYRIRVPNNKLLWLNAAVHLAVIHTHLFGGFYSAAILVSIFLTDRYFSLFRPKLYLSIIFSWLSILLYIPSFLNQADVGKPRTWLPQPELLDIVNVMNISASTFFNRAILPLLLFFLLLYLLRRIDSRPNVLSGKAVLFSSSEISIIIFAVVYIAVPVFVWIFSLTIKPIFLDRYMLPTAVGWAVFFTYIFHRILPPSITGFNFSLKPKSPPEIRITLGLLLPSAALIFFLITPLRQAKGFQEKGLFENLPDLKKYSGLPVVVQSSHTFLQNLHYSPNPDKYYFMLDWQAAIDENSGTFSPQEFKHMEALKRNYPQMFKNVVSTDNFLNKYDRFLVLDSEDYTRKCPPKSKGLRHVAKSIYCPQWVEMRLLSDTVYNVTVVNSSNLFTILLVQRRDKTTRITSSFARLLKNG
ncbi:MAG: hypothetical protein WKF91_08910, partial [Segetibacter sp.]